MAKTKLSQTVVSNESFPVNGPPVGGTSPAAVEFDLERFKVSQDFAGLVATRKKATVVPVGRPDKQSWIYLHPDPAWRIQVGLLDDKQNNRQYLVDPQLMPELMGDLVLKLLVPYMSRQGNAGLWSIRLPDESGRIDSYSESALAIVAESSGVWLRILTNPETRAYDVLTCTVEIPQPTFPDGGIRGMCSIAFRNRIIESLEHPALKALRGGL